VKTLSLSSFFLSDFVCFSTLIFEKPIEKMAGGSTSTVKFMNPYPLKINVVKFDGKNNFRMWRYEVMDALTASNLEETLWLEKNPEATSEEDWDKMNRMACGLIRFYLTQDIKYHVLLETFARQL